MANVNQPSGMQPVENGSGEPYSGGGTLYFIPSTDTNQYNIGDLVKSVAGVDTGGTTGLGVTWAPACVKAAAGNTCVGTMMGVMTDPNNLAVINVPATKLHDYAIIVMDDPSAVFEITDDGITTANLVSTAVGKNCNFTVANPTAPSPVSATVINSSTIATTSTLPLKIVGVKQLDNQTMGPYVRWLVRWNLHEFFGGTSGV